MTVQVVCGVIWNQEKILVARKKEGKSNAFLWELPGGKVEKGESYEDCLKRELSEELTINVFVGPKFGEYEYKDHVKTIKLIAYHARAHSEAEDRLDGSLPDHDRIAWMEVWRLFSLQWAPADVPLVEKLVRFQTLNPFAQNP
jgi:8-oxo-dGTP diphosphatase